MNDVPDFSEWRGFTNVDLRGNLFSPGDLPPVSVLENRELFDLLCAKVQHEGLSTVVVSHGFPWHDTQLAVRTVGAMQRQHQIGDSPVNCNVLNLADRFARTIDDSRTDNVGILAGQMWSHGYFVLYTARRVDDVLLSNIYRDFVLRPRKHLSEKVAKRCRTHAASRGCLVNGC